MNRCGCISLVLVITGLILSGCATGVAEGEVAEVYFKLGNAYFDLAEFDNAVNAYTQALEYDQSLVKAGYNLAHVYLETGRITDAREILLGLLEDEPENTVLLATLGWAHYLEGDLDAALEIYRRVSNRLEGDPDALFNTATLLWQAEEYSEALEHFLSLYELDPSVEYIPSIAELYAVTGDPETAILYLELYVSEKDDIVLERVKLANLYSEVREYGKSVAMYSEAIDLQESTDVKALFARGSILLAYIEDTDRGIEDLETAFAGGFDDETAIAELEELVPTEALSEFNRLVTQYGFLQETSADDSFEDEEESENAGAGL